MTVIGKESQEPLAGGAAAAAWRRRQQVSAAPPPTRNDGKYLHEFQAATNSVNTNSPGAADDFAASQQAGLRAMISLAKPESPRRPLCTENTSTSLLERPASQPDRSSSPLPTPAEPVIASVPLRDLPGTPADPASVTQNYSPLRRVQAEPERSTKRNGYGLAHLRLPLLIAILTVQAVLSLRLVWSNTAYIDEATYLWAGHLEIAHWLQGTPVPPFQTWLSGAPAIYPPVGAVADSLGRLYEARILSLVFMTCATALLWNITSRLFGNRSAFFASTLFAILGPTQFLGALATYDAMALLLMAISVWCVVAAQDHDDSTPLLVAGAIILALANATKYATALFDPVIVVLAALLIVRHRGVKPAFGRAGYLAATVTALIAALIALGGPLYMAGIMYTTLARAAGNNSPALVLEDAWKWAGIVWVFAWLGVIISMLRKGPTMLLALLATAGLLAPLEQSRIHTITSLHKHVDFGAWLAAPAAGYALAKLSQISKHRSLSLMAGGLIAAAAFVPVAEFGSAQAKVLFNGWPDSSAIIAKLRALTPSYPGNYLAEDYDIPAYYLENRVSEERWSNTWFFSYTIPGSNRSLTGAAAYRAAITRHYFSLIILDFGATPGTDRQITADIRQAGGYHIVAVVRSSFSQYTIWAHTPVQRSGRQNDHR